MAAPSPIDIVSDMALSLDRVATMLGSSNNDLIEHVVNVLPDGQATYRQAYACWCAATIAVEKIREIIEQLDAAETALLSAPSKGN